MKKLFGLLTFVLIGLINFGYCENVEDLIDVVQENSSYNVDGRWKNLKDLNSSEYGVYCLKVNSYEGFPAINFGYSQATYYVNPGDYITMWLGNSLNDHITCISIDQPHIWVGYYDNNQSTIIDYELFKLDDLLAEALPLMTSLECQQAYNLMPISDVDQNYCVNNGLCPSSGGGECPGSGDLQYSNIYINNILHPGRQNIFIDIPDYITWDYSQNEVDFNVYVGSGYDVDYINSIVDINSYRPTSDDFTNVFVSGLTLIFPYIFVALLILFIWKLVKRIFK